MTLEDWATAYLLRFGNGNHLGWLPGEEDFIRDSLVDLHCYEDIRDAESREIRRFQVIRDEIERQQNEHTRRGRREEDSGG